MKEILTLEKLKSMEANEMFATGTLLGRKWVAVRGGIWDWAIYQGDILDSDTYVRKCGDKVYEAEVIRWLVPCDDEAFAMYRY